MPLPTPRLDDRSFQDLVDEGITVIARDCPVWTDHSSGDPGIVLLEAFAYLTDAMLYRLNRVPEKLYVTLLNLMGVSQLAPSAAAVQLTFARTTKGNDPVAIPMGTRIASADGTVVFTTTASAKLDAGAASVVVDALHCDVELGEFAGTGAGGPGQSVRLKKPPVIATSGDNLDLIVGVETRPEDPPSDQAQRSFGDKAFRVWHEVASFTDTKPADPVYIADRGAGLIVFAPAGLGLAPPAGRDIRVWYRHGGGRAGNVGAGTLTVFKDKIEGLSVTNAARAAGGANGETLQAALQRGPRELRSLRCAVTARDFEALALEVGGIARARAYAQAQMWRHAQPGVVEVLLVPDMNPEARPKEAVTAAAYRDHMSETLRTKADAAVHARRPLGVQSVMAWAQVQPVSVAARIVVFREDDKDEILNQVIVGLNALLSPLRNRPFGRVVRESDVYSAVLSVPGVKFADGITFTIEQAPSKDVIDVTADANQPNTWFAVAGDSVYRTLDDGDSWANVFTQAGDKPLFTRTDVEKPGLVVVGTARGDSGAIFVSQDCGETWRQIAVFGFAVADACWIMRDGAPSLLVATRKGLFHLPLGGGGPAPMQVDVNDADRGFYAVTAARAASGAISVAVVARELGGVYLSAFGGTTGTFRLTGLNGKDIRSVVVQRFAGRDFLWAQAAAVAGQNGEGAFRIELRSGSAGDADGWKPFSAGWQGGSCECLALTQNVVYAGSNRAGVLALDLTAANPTWTVADLNSGLPIRSADRLHHEVVGLAASGDPAKPILMAGGPLGVYRSTDQNKLYTNTSMTVFTDRAPLPRNWLYCTDPHNVTVVVEDGRRG
jgi:hypothetical protein